MSDINPIQIINDPEAYSMDERLDALADVLDDRVWTTNNGPAYPAFSEAAAMIRMVLNDDDFDAIQSVDSNVDVYGCIECPQSVGNKRRLSVSPEQPDPIYCPYCGNQSLITDGDELRRIEAYCE